jgi:hypothetical protein
VAATVRQRHESDRSTGWSAGRTVELTCQLWNVVLVELGRVGQTERRRDGLRIHDSGRARCGCSAVSEEE